MHAMGLLWSMLPSQGRRQGVLFEPPPGRSAVNLTAMADGHLIARQRIVRETLAPGVQVTHLRPRTSGLYGSLYTRPVQRRGAAVLVLGGSGGGLDLAGGIARMLVSHGFPAFALAYFREPGLPHELKEVRLEYFAHALRRLAHTPGIDPRRIAVVGISRGSEAAQLLGVHYPRLVHAVVGYVPSSVVNPGLRSADGPWLHTSAWSLHGRPIPYVRRRWLHVPNPTSDPQAMIPDERILGPILLISAEQDNVWPSSGYAKAIIARLDAHHFRYFHRALDYAAAGHAVGVGVPDLSLDCAYDICPLGGTTVGNATSRADSWRGLLDFLEAFGAGKPRF